MQQGPAHVGHREAAEVHGPAAVEALHRADQAEAGHLEQVILAAATRRAHAGGHAAGQRQVGGDQGIAPTQAAGLIPAALQLAQQLGVALAQQLSAGRLGGSCGWWPDLRAGPLWARWLQGPHLGGGRRGGMEHGWFGGFPSGWRRAAGGRSPPWGNSIHPIGCCARRPFTGCGAQALAVACRRCSSPAHCSRAGHWRTRS